MEHATFWVNVAQLIVSSSPSSASPSSSAASRLQPAAHSQPQPPDAPQAASRRPAGILFLRATHTQGASPLEGIRPTGRVIVRSAFVEVEIPGVAVGASAIIGPALAAPLIAGQE